MPDYAYLDTNAFRYFGHAFENATLADDLRDKLLISPLNAFEVFAQLADERDGETVLRHVHAIRNWTNPKRSGLLPWPDEWIYQLWYQRPRPDDGFTQKMENSFNACLACQSATALKTHANDHKEIMDTFKFNYAEVFGKMVGQLRKQKRQKRAAFDITAAWFLGIANRIGADPSSKSVTPICVLLSAYYEFEDSKVRRALRSANYNALSRDNQNDIIDAEQLVYLADPSLA